MRKNYSAPAIYCEDLELNPVINTACTAQYDGNVYHGQMDGTPEPGSNPVEGVSLFFANSLDCVGLQDDPSGEGGSLWTFHSKSGPTSWACLDITNQPGYDPSLGDGLMVSDNTCLNIPWFVLGKTMES